MTTLTGAGFDAADMRARLLERTLGKVRDVHPPLGPVGVHGFAELPVGFGGVDDFARLSAGNRVLDLSAGDVIEVEEADGLFVDVKGLSQIHRPRRRLTPLQPHSQDPD